MKPHRTKRKQGVLLCTALVALGIAANATAQARHDEKPHGTPKPSEVPVANVPDGIPLKDGGKLIINKDGTTYHVDAAGKRVRMRDGVSMEGVDGTRYMMKNDVIWKAITEKGTLHPTHQ
jgi:hypothetical protein